MGTVYAKEAERHNAFGRGDGGPETEEDCEPGKKRINLEGVQARVDKIHIDGLSRTKDDIVLAAVRELFKAKDFQQVIVGAHKVRGKLDSLGCFRNIGIYIDVSSGPEASPHGLEVTFHVAELKRIVGGVNTLVGNNEGSLVVGLRAPNLFGRGEKLQSEYSYGSRKTTGFNIAFSKPLRGRGDQLFTASVFQQGAEWPVSAYKNIERGILLDLGMTKFSGKVRMNLQWEGVFRELSCLTRTAAFAVREQAGPSLKSSVRLALGLDQRDSTVFPTSGLLLRLTNEFAGLGGNIGFFKSELEMQETFSVPGGVVVTGGLQGGFMTNVGSGKTISICDRFFLGGPLSLRGFELRGAGPHVDGNAVGANLYWAGGMHLYTPLPFQPGKGGFGELFRTHIFYNFGNIGDIENGNVVESVQSLLKGIRMSYGLGLALRLGQLARVELNYCIPLSMATGDRPCHGVQLGVGVHFL